MAKLGAQGRSTLYQEGRKKEPWEFHCDKELKGPRVPHQICNTNILSENSKWVALAGKVLKKMFWSIQMLQHMQWRMKPEKETSKYL